MIPTVPWMKEKFSEFNEKYFENRLPVPEFAVGPLNKLWGAYDLVGRFNKGSRKIINAHGNGKITLSNTRQRNEKSISNTLLHEMTHEYVCLVLGLYPRDRHGKEFMSMANRINADGWNIASSAAEESVKDTSEESPNSAVIYVIQNPSSKLAKWWVCRVEEADMPNFESRVKTIKGVTSAKFYRIKGVSLSNIESNPSLLTGYGGNSYAEAAKKMADFCKVSPSFFSGKNLTPIN